MTHDAAATTHEQFQDGRPWGGLPVEPGGVLDGTIALSGIQSLRPAHWPNCVVWAGSVGIGIDSREQLRSTLSPYYTLHPRYWKFLNYVGICHHDFRFC
jgi:hypothetical protein